MNKAQQGQSFLDMVVQLTGNIDNALDMALKNNVSITDNIAIGAEFTAVSTTNKSVVEYMENNNPATAINTEDSTLTIYEGISFWAIDNDFIVS